MIVPLTVRFFVPPTSTWNFLHKGMARNLVVVRGAIAWQPILGQPTLTPPSDLFSRHCKHIAHCFPSFVSYLTLYPSHEESTVQDIKHYAIFRNNSHSKHFVLWLLWAMLSWLTPSAILLLHSLMQLLFSYYSKKTGSCAILSLCLLLRTIWLIQNAFLRNQC